MASGPTLCYVYRIPVHKNRNNTVSTGSAGGGIAVLDATIILQNATVTANQNSGDYSTGGGLWARGAKVYLTDSIISDNRCTNGGGVALVEREAILGNLTITGNRASSSDFTWARGGGAYFQDCNPTVVNATFAANEGELGGGLYLVDASPLLSTSPWWTMRPATWIISRKTAGAAGFIPPAPHRQCW